jgi:Holliday junction resolvase-like predicted endonuclease
VVAFVEVKTRAPSRFGDGREAVGWRKRRGLTVAAAAWQARFGSPGDRYRFDVITVAAGGGILAHLEDAWRPTRS